MPQGGLTPGLRHGGTDRAASGLPALRKTGQFSHGLTVTRGCVCFLTYGQNRFLTYSWKILAIFENPWYNTLKSEKLIRGASYGTEKSHSLGH